jgi:hypothetical protein
MSLTPEEEAARGLDHGVSGADLNPDAQTADDRTLRERKAAATPPWAGTLVPSARRPEVPAGHPRVPITWQADSLRPEWHAEAWGWLFGVVLLSAVAGFGGTDVALAVACVAVLAVLHRFYRAMRARKAAKAPQPAPSPFSPCHHCGYPFAAHFGDNLMCPLAGICYRCGQPLTAHGRELTCPASAPNCYRCGQPLTAHTGRELTCPASAPNCYRCGQPFAAHVGDGLTCPAPQVSVSQSL